MRAVLTVLAIWCAGLGAAAQFGKISVSFDALGTAYADWPGVWIGLMVSIVGLVGLVFGTTAGLLVARVGVRRAMLGALLAGAAVSLAESFLPPYPAMMIFRVIEGASHLAIVVVGPTAIAGLASGPRQGAAMTLWSSFFGLTYAVLAWVGPMVLAAGGVALLFRLHGLWMLACAVILAGVMPDDVRPAVPQRRLGVLAEHQAIYRSPFLAAPATGFVCYTITYVAVLTLLPGALGGAWGQAAGVAMPLASIGVSLTLGVWLLSVIPAVKIGQAGFAVAVLAAAGLWLFWGRGPWAFGATLVLGGALGVVQGAAFASIPQLNALPEDRARAAGAIAQLGNLGTTTGTPILALLMQKAGEAGLALFVMGFSVLGIAVIAIQARRRVRS